VLRHSRSEATGAVLPAGGRTGQRPGRSGWPVSACTSRSIPAGQRPPARPAARIPSARTLASLPGGSRPEGAGRSI